MPHIYYTPTLRLSPNPRIMPYAEPCCCIIAPKSRSQKALSAAPRTELRIGWGDEPPTHGECAVMMAAAEEMLALEEAM